MVENIVSLYAKLDTLNADQYTTKRQRGAARAQISKARYNHYERVDQLAYKANPNQDRSERLNASSAEAKRQVETALKAAGRDNTEY